MPLSSGGQGIDYIYGVINWKEIADSETEAKTAGEVDRAIADAPAPVVMAHGEESPVWRTGPIPTLSKRW